MSGVAHHEPPNLRGAGGPAWPLDTVTTIEDKTQQVEQKLRTYEELLRKRAMMPSAWPVDGNLTDSFVDAAILSAARQNFIQDIATIWGAPVRATANGTVIFTGWQNGYRQVVIMDHGDGLTTRYGHLSRVEATLGQAVTRGELLGRVGSTGRSTGPHLHYEARVNDEPVNPMPYLPVSTD